jgi:hypothetical protein
LVSGGASYELELEPKSWDYRVLAPVLGDIALIGDPNLYACAGDARIADVEVAENGVVVTVLGADERVRLVGWSRRAIAARVCVTGRRLDGDFDELRRQHEHLGSRGGRGTDRLEPSPPRDCARAWRLNHRASACQQRTAGFAECSGCIRVQMLLSR